jgi:hypothetical protein
VIKETTEIAFSALFLDIYLKFITDGSLSITLYDKKNDFSLDYLNLPHFDLILILVYQPLRVWNLYFPVLLFLQHQKA